MSDSAPSRSELILNATDDGKTKFSPRTEIGQKGSAKQNEAVGQKKKK